MLANRWMKTMNRRFLLVFAAMSLWLAAESTAAYAASARQIDQGVDQALRRLYAAQPRARNLASRAKAILVFPSIIKAGLMIGGQSGNGALRINGRTDSYYNLSAASFGLQAGGQKFSYALFFMNDAALKYLESSDGWAIGSGPSVA